MGGFTLLEFLIVFSLISIMVTLSGLGFRSLTASFRLQAQMRELYYTFLQARQYAIINQMAYGLKFDAKKREYSLFSTDKGNIFTRKLRNGIDFQSGEIVFGCDSQMTFKPVGTAEGGHVILTNSLHQKYSLIVFSQTGRVRFEKVQQ